MLKRPLTLRHLVEARDIRRADKLARRMKISRSEVVRRALAAYLDKEE